MTALTQPMVRDDTTSLVDKARPIANKGGMREGKPIFIEA